MAMPITAIKRQSRQRRLSIFVDGAFVVALGEQAIRDAGLQVGDELSEECLEELYQADHRHFAWQAATRLLSYRPRSKLELRQRLLSKGVSEVVVGETIERLQDLSLVNDDEFARQWIEMRQHNSPRSPKLLARELRSKGVDRDLVSEVTGSLEESSIAYIAAQRRASQLAKAEFPVFRRKLNDFLLRRGFGHGIVAITINQLWREMQDDLPDDHSIDQNT